MSWPVIVSNLCIKTSNIGRKIIKVGKVTFLCVLKLLSHKWWSRGIKLIEKLIM